MFGVLTFVDQFVNSTIYLCRIYTPCDCEARGEYIIFGSELRLDFAPFSDRWGGSLIGGLQVQSDDFFNFNSIQSGNELVHNVVCGSIRGVPHSMHLDCVGFIQVDVQGDVSQTHSSICHVCARVDPAACPLHVQPQPHVWLQLPCASALHHAPAAGSGSAF